MSYGTSSPQFMSHDSLPPRMSNQGAPDAQMFFNNTSPPQQKQVIDPELLGDMGFLSHNGAGYGQVGYNTSSYPSPP